MNDEEKKIEAERKEAEEATAREKAEAAEAEKARIEANKIPAVEEAKKIAVDLKTENDRREKILEEEKKVMDRKESLNALGGGSPGGTDHKKPEETPKEYNDRIEKEISEGKHDE